MACYNPQLAYISATLNPTGKRGITFKPNEAYKDRTIQLPCASCVGCRLDHARDWAIRCMHEAQLHEDNVFLTLTYNDQSLPPNGSLLKSDFQEFMKRLRHTTPDKIRYFQCGEYGTRTGRAHYHALLFGYDFPDKQKLCKANDHVQYTSELLDKTWSLGQCTIGSVTSESAGYCARYNLSKVQGTIQFPWYENPQLIPPYITMSRSPGIGYDWYQKFKADLYPDDFVLTENKSKHRVPRYYDEMYKNENPIAFRRIKAHRIRAALKRGDNSAERLAVKEEIKLKQLSELERNKL